MEGESTELSPTTPPSRPIGPVKDRDRHRDASDFRATVLARFLIAILLADTTRTAGRFHSFPNKTGDTMHSPHIVKELVQIARDGASFYSEAMRKVEDPHIKAIFSSMAQHKQQIIDSLSANLRMNDQEPPSGGTAAGMIRKSYADLLAAISSKDAKVYVSQLEETEDRLLRRFEEAIEDADDPAVVSLLQSHMPQVRACHDEMRTLKEGMMV